MAFNYFNPIKAIIQKEMYRLMRIPFQTILPPAITMVLYFLVFGSFLGNRIGTINGVSYITFIAPGLIMMSVLNNTYSSVCSGLYSQKFQRNIEDLMTAPVSCGSILIGFLASGLLRGLIIGILVTCIAAFFNPLVFTHYIVLLVGFILSLLPLALAGFINGLLANSFEATSIIPTFIITPLTYLGGVFFPVDHLPAIWQKISLFNPILYMIDLFRYGMLGITNINISLAISILLLFNIILFFIAYIMLKRGIGIRK